MVHVGIMISVHFLRFPVKHLTAGNAGMGLSIFPQGHFSSLDSSLESNAISQMEHGLNV